MQEVSISIGTFRTQSGLKGRYDYSPTAPSRLRPAALLLRVNRAGSVMSGLRPLYPQQRP